MTTLISAILSNYVPMVIIASMILGIFAVAFAGIIRNSGKIENVARSNQIVQTVIVGLIMLFFSGIFVFAVNDLYVSRFYGQVENTIQARLPNTGDISNTSLLSSQIGTPSQPDTSCYSFITSTAACIKQTINDVIGSFISQMVRGLGGAVVNVLNQFNFNFLFALPADVFSGGTQRTAAFNDLLNLSEIIGLAFVYLLIVTHYFKAILFSLDSDYSNDFAGDIGRMLFGFAGVFFARYIAQAVITTAQAFASFLFAGPLAGGLTTALQVITTDALWSSFSTFGISLVILAIFVLVYIILFGFVIFRNAKRYFILLLMILLSPIFTPMLFFDMTQTMGKIFWHKFIVTSFSLTVDLLILLIVFVFLSSGGLSLGNLILMLVGMAIIADSNNLIQQIAASAEVAGFKSTVRSGLRSSTTTFMSLKRMLE